MTGIRCAANANPALCCTPGAWEQLAEMGERGFRTYGEPLPEEVIAVAAARGIEPHALDHHVEGVHGVEPHDMRYPEAVKAAAACLTKGECE